MTGYIVLAALVAFTLFGPIQKRTVTNWARHNALFVVLPYDSVTENSGQSPDGRRAQELGENRFQGLVGLIPAAGVVYATEGGLLGSVGAVVAYVVAKSILYAFTFIDTAGHGAEILVAEREKRFGYRNFEIDRMLEDGRRNGQTFEDVERSLKRWRWLSKLMIGLAR